VGRAALLLVLWGPCAHAQTAQSIPKEAFDVKPWQIKGPAWTASDMYEIAAITPPDSTRDDVRLMLRGMLVERFGLKFHLQQKDLPVYALVLSKGGLRVSPMDDPPATFNYSAGFGHFSATAISIPMLADLLGRDLGLPMVDMTNGIKGRYRVDLRWSPDPDQIARGLSEALERDLGLKLEARKTPVSLVFLDHIEREPTAN
jgi:uncharacterized protein (TIGR03435 family)